jgi:hypothetical protein
MRYVFLSWFLQLKREKKFAKAIANVIQKSVWKDSFEAIKRESGFNSKYELQ